MTFTFATKYLQCLKCRVPAASTAPKKKQKMYKKKLIHCKETFIFLWQTILWFSSCVVWYSLRVDFVCAASISTHVPSVRIYQIISTQLNTKKSVSSSMNTANEKKNELIETKSPKTNRSRRTFLVRQFCCWLSFWKTFLLFFAHFLACTWNVASFIYNWMSRKQRQAKIKPTINERKIEESKRLKCVHFHASNARTTCFVGASVSNKMRIISCIIIFFVMFFYWVSEAKRNETALPLFTEHANKKRRGTNTQIARCLHIETKWVRILFLPLEKCSSMSTLEEVYWRSSSWSWSICNFITMSMLWPPSASLWLD